jgi:hypothetical protein
VDDKVEESAIFQWPVHKHCKSAAAVLLILVCSVVLHMYDPAKSTLFPPCPFHALTGLHCPGCGTLRALHELLHGHPVTAFGLNPLTVLCLPVVGYIFLCKAVPGRRLRSLSISAFWGWILLGAIAVFWIMRNVPAYPFSLLAP